MMNRKNLGILIKEEVWILYQTSLGKLSKNFWHDICLQGTLRKAIMVYCSLMK